MTPTRYTVRNLVVILGDQLNSDSPVFDDFDPRQDRVWMAEVDEESTHVWTHKARIAIFLSAMRHFRQELGERGIFVEYRELSARKDFSSFESILGASLEKLRPETVRVVEPGEWRVAEQIRKACAKHQTPLEILEDRHFFCTTAEFRDYCRGRSGLRMEFFYREMRRRHRILMSENGTEPEGGAWNFDRENRGSFEEAGPGRISHLSTEPDELTREVIELVQTRFPDHPGELKGELERELEVFDWPVTRAESLRHLKHFITNHLSQFGLYQDAMWMNEPFLHHSRLSAAMNLKLLSPREVVAAAEKAYQQKRAPLAAVEGFIRQILGWREYVRGVYHQFMPQYLERNELDAQASLPAFYWTGKTEFRCLSQTLSQTLRYGYAHHIQRLMVTGLFSLLLGVHPKQVHEWYLAVYVDAVEWVELPNTLGMSQYADGGIMASKPYIASGKYIERMSNYCESCPRSPEIASGPKACPFTTLYWDFIDRHQTWLKRNPRLAAQVGNWNRFAPEKKKLIQEAALKFRKQI